MRVEIPNQITVTIGGLISRGVKAVEVTDAGKLIFTLTDGSTADLGSVIGPQGPKGETGASRPRRGRPGRRARRATPERRRERCVAHEEIAERDDGDIHDDAVRR